MPTQTPKPGQMWNISLQRIDSLRSATSEYISGYQQYPLNFWLCTLLLFLANLGCAILGAPSPALLERAVCRQHFEQEIQLLQEEPPDEFCRRKEVQVHFAFVITVLSTLSILAATTMQIPMGILVDKGGRRLAFALNIFSTILYWGSVAAIGFARDFPLWCFYLPPIFVLFGGGPWATGTLVFAAISDSVRPEQRTTAFSIMEAISGIADLVGPILGAVTMTTNIGIPFTLALGVFTLMYIPAFYLTEDQMDDMEENALPTAETESLLGPRDIVDHESLDSEFDYERMVRSKTLIFGICFVCFFLYQIARDSTGYLIPWVSLRFDETMARAGLLFSLRAIVSSLLYFIILPVTTSWLDKTWKSLSRDLVLSAAGVVCAAVGSLAVSFAPNTVTVALGFAVSVLGSSMTVTLRSFLASNTHTAFSGRLFAGVSTFGTIGSLVGMPIMGAAYSLGIDQDIGLPFLVSAASYSLVFGLLAWLAIKI